MHKRAAARSCQRIGPRQRYGRLVFVRNKGSIGRHGHAAGFTQRVANFGIKPHIVLRSGEIIGPVAVADAGIVLQLLRRVAVMSVGFHPDTGENLLDVASFGGD